MSTTVQFYHLLSTTRERAVPKLMEKALGSGARVVMQLPDETNLKRMSDALWTADPNGFLPHGVAHEKHASEQPILLTCDGANPNGAEILCVLDGSMPGNARDYKKLLDVFDGANADEVAAARARWAHYKTQGFTLQYVKQQPGGSWKVEAEAA